MATAQPVGSQALVTRYGLGVSPATVRNVMAELEALGLSSTTRTRAPGACPPTRAIGCMSSPITDAVALAPVEQLDDPPPVRAGGVRQRPVVPARRRDPRHRRPTSRASRPPPSHPRAASAGSISCPPARARRASWSSSPRGRCKQVVLATEHPYTDGAGRGARRATLAQLLAGRSARGRVERAGGARVRPSRPWTRSWCGPPLASSS